MGSCLVKLLKYECDYWRILCYGKTTQNFAIHELWVGINIFMLLCSCALSISGTFIFRRKLSPPINQTPFAITASPWEPHYIHHTLWIWPPWNALHVSKITQYLSFCAICFPLYSICKVHRFWISFFFEIINFFLYVSFDILSLSINVPYGLLPCLAVVNMLLNVSVHICSSPCSVILDVYPKWDARSYDNLYLTFEGTTTFFHCACAVQF